jgi:hypothetical protein
VKHTGINPCCGAAHPPSFQRSHSHSRRGCWGCRCRWSGSWRSWWRPRRSTSHCIVVSARSLALPSDSADHTGAKNVEARKRAQQIKTLTGENLALGLLGVPQMSLTFPRAGTVVLRWCSGCFRAARAGRCSPVLFRPAWSGSWHGPGMTSSTMEKSCGSSTPAVYPTGPRPDVRLCPRPEGTSATAALGAVAPVTHLPRREGEAGDSGEGARRGGGPLVPVQGGFRRR